MPSGGGGEGGVRSCRSGASWDEAIAASSGAAKQASGDGTEGVVLSHTFVGAGGAGRARAPGERGRRTHFGMITAKGPKMQSPAAAISLRLV